VAKVRGENLIEPLALVIEVGYLNQYAIDDHDPSWVKLIRYKIEKFSLKTLLMEEVDFF
jgi:hypothetical protein